LKLNSRYVATGGRTVPHVDGVTIPAFVGRQAGSPVGCWFGNQPLNQVRFPDQDGKQVWKLVAASGEVLSDEGQNHLFANPRLWCADLNGYRDSLGHVDPNLSPVALDDTSNAVAVAVKGTNSLAVWDGAVLLMVEPTGPDVWEEPDICFRDGLLMYRKNGRLKTWPETRDIAHIQASGICHDTGYLLEWQEGRGVVLRSESTTRGIVISRDGHDYGRDIRLRDDGLLVIVSSSGPEERPEEFRRYVVNPVLGTVEREWIPKGQPGRIVTEPFVNLAAPTTKTLTVPTFAPAPIWCIPFDWTGVPNVSDVFAWGTFRLGNSAELAGVLAKAHARGVLSLGYYDEASFDLSQVPSALDYVGIQCYPDNDIATDVLVTLAEQDIQSCLNAKPKRPCVLVVATYTGSGKWDAQRVLDLLGGLWALAAKYGVDVAPFGNLRPPFYPEFDEAIRRMLAAGKGHPAPSPQPQPSSLEFLMGALTLKRSQFKDGSFDPSRKLYPDVTDHSKHLSIDSVTGDPRPGGMPGNGPSESFIVKGDRAVVDFGTHAYTFPVTD
jgi:hypothetical protein